MSVVLPSHYKIACPFCSGEIKVPAESIGQLSTCEHCRQEITLDLKNYEPSQLMTYNASSRNTLARLHGSVSSQMISVGYLLAIVVPLVGFVVGIYFLTKNQFGHGIGCMIVSLIGSGLWLLVFNAIT